MRPRRAKRARFASEKPGLTYFDLLSYDVCSVITSCAIAAEASDPAMKYLLPAKRTATALRLANIGGALGTGACQALGNWIEHDMVTTADVQLAPFGALVLETRGAEYKAIRKLAQLVKQYWTSLTFKNFAVTKCYANIIRVHGANLKRLEVIWEKRFFRWTSICPAELGKKLNSVFNAAGEMDVIKLNFYSINSHLVTAIAAHVHNWHSLTLSFSSVMDLANPVRLDPIWKAIGADETKCKLKNLYIETPIKDNGEDTDYMLEEEVLKFKTLGLLKQQINISVNDIFW